MVPLAVLERVGAIPYSVDETTLRIALTDPDNVHGIDELRLTSKLPVEFAVAPLEDVMVEVRRLTRANVALGAVVDDDAYQAVEEEPDDLTAEDGISEGPIVRLVNSIIFQAAPTTSTAHPTAAIGWRWWPCARRSMTWRCGCPASGCA